MSFRSSYSRAVWAQYVLDRFATVVEALVLHLPLKDIVLGGEASGNFETSAPFEFLEAKP